VAAAGAERAVGTAKAPGAAEPAEPEQDAAEIHRKGAGLFPQNEELARKNSSSSNSELGIGHSF